MALKKYPFIDRKELKKNGRWLKLPVNYCLSKLAKNLKPKVEQQAKQTGNWFWKGAARVVDLYERNKTQYVEVNFPFACPKIAVWRGFAKGSSKIENLYTVEYSGRELPVFIKSKDKLPVDFDAKIEENIKYILNNEKSVYDTDNLESFYEDYFTEPAASKYTRGDFPSSFPDPGRFKKWLVRDETWIIQQYGKVEEIKTVNVDGTNYIVKKYGRPSKMRCWWNWFWGDKIYDFIDSFFDPIQKQVKKLSSEFNQAFVEQEYKGISAVNRTLFNPRTPALAYEIK